MDQKDYEKYLAHMKIEDLPEVFRPVAGKVGLAKFMELSEYLGGISLYIPFPEKMVTKVRNRMILEEYPHLSFAEIARKYKLTETWVRDIIREQQAPKEQKKT